MGGEPQGFLYITVPGIVLMPPGFCWGSSDDGHRPLTRAPRELPLKRNKTPQVFPTHPATDTPTQSRPRLLGGMSSWALTPIAHPCLLGLTQVSHRGRAISQLLVVGGQSHSRKRTPEAVVLRPVSGRQPDEGLEVRARPGLALSSGD